MVIASSRIAISPMGQPSRSSPWASRSEIAARRSIGSTLVEELQEAPLELPHRFGEPSLHGRGEQVVPGAVHQHLRCRVARRRCFTRQFDQLGLGVAEELAHQLLEADRNDEIVDVELARVDATQHSRNARRERIGIVGLTGMMKRGLHQLSAVLPQLAVGGQKPGAENPMQCP
jgi:hypothetical protein